ncbi:MAG: hypothetical protein ABII00_02035 [Elusimicrobiota bacterium]
MRCLRSWCASFLAGVLVLGAGATPAAGHNALRNAALTVIAVRRTSTVEDRHAALGKAFDAAPRSLRDSGEPGAGRRSLSSDGRYSVRRNWFPPSGRYPAQAPAFSMPDVSLPPAAPGPLDRLRSAARSAFGPWRALLEYAWGGAWTGASVLRAR